MHAARKRFLREGVDGASLRRIAHDARTSIGMIYYYFPTKNDLFLAVVEEIYGRFLDDLEKVLRHDVPVPERLRRLSVRLGAMGSTELDVMRLVAREAMTSSARRERLVQRFLRGHVGMLLQTLSEGIAAGDIDSRHHPLVLMMATLAVAGVPQAMRKLIGRAFPDAPESDALASALIDILVHGIAKRSPA